MHRSLFLGFIKLHILHHASSVAVFGFDLIRELSCHGYVLSPGTLYPILHKLHDDGFLTRHTETVNGKVRKCYRITPQGNAALKEGVFRARELLDEIET